MPRALYRALPAEPTGQRAVKSAPAFSPLLGKVFRPRPLPPCTTRQLSEGEEWILLVFLIAFCIRDVLYHF